MLIIYSELYLNDKSLKTMSVKIFRIWITTVLQCLQGISAIVTWIIEPSITNGISSVGQITNYEDINLGQCVVECFMDTTCVTIGFSSSISMCQLYDIDIDYNQEKKMSTATNTFFYKYVCDNQAYTYIRRLNTCIRRNSTELQFDEARANCLADGGDLLMVKNNDVYTYLQDTMIFGTDSEIYWLGAIQDPENHSLWFWVDGTRMTNDTGWIYWDENEPSSNPNSFCLLGRVLSIGVVFKDRECTIPKPFVCEMAP